MTNKLYDHGVAFGLSSDEHGGVPVVDKRLKSPFEPTLRFLCIENRERLEGLATRTQFCLYPLRDWNRWTAEDRKPVLAMLRSGQAALDELMELLGEGVEGCK